MYHWITVGKMIDFFLRLSNDATAFFVLSNFCKSGIFHAICDALKILSPQESYYANKI